MVDADIIRYEVSYAAEAGWRAKTNSTDLPPFSFVRDILEQRLADICFACKTNKTPRLFYTEGRTFRYDLAKRRPYKGTRQEKKPFHFDNITVYLRDILGAEPVTHIEADDKLAIEHTSSNGTTVLVSRDKDCRQCPGYFYSWELGHQPSWGPALITKEGSLKFTPANPEKKRPAKLTGTGLSFFYAQVLMGDSTDNIPGLPSCGPVRAYEILNGKTPEGQLRDVIEAYALEYGYTDQVAPRELTEQGKLTWLVRKLNEDGSPVTWEIGMTE